MELTPAMRGLMAASAEKRYKNFLSTAADSEEVWMLASEDGYASFDTDDGKICLLVWPERCFAEWFADGDEPELVEVHDFCDRCREVEDDDAILFAVFPTEGDSFVVTPSELLSDLEEALAELE